MHPRRLMITGVVLMMAATAIFAFGCFMTGEEENSIDAAVPFDGGSADPGRPGDLFIIEGKISARNKVLAHDFVDGAKEHLVKGGSWTILETYRQPVIADLARGEIILTSETICSEAAGNNILETDETSPWGNRVRYVGLKRGDPITAVGTLTSRNPTALTVKYWYSGSIAGYRNFLASSRKGLYIFCLLIGLAGTGLFLWGLKGRRPVLSS